MAQANIQLLEVVVHVVGLPGASVHLAILAKVLVVLAFPLGRAGSVGGTGGAREGGLRVLVALASRAGSGTLLLVSSSVMHICVLLGSRRGIGLRVDRVGGVGGSVSMWRWRVMAIRLALCGGGKHIRVLVRSWWLLWSNRSTRVRVARRASSTRVKVLRLSGGQDPKAYEDVLLVALYDTGNNENMTRNAPHTQDHN